MNIIVDTNIFVATGFNPRSNSAKILRAIENGTINLTWNEATKRETQYMIEKIPRLSWLQFAGLFKSENEYKGETNSNNYNFIEDPDDRKFAALGEASNTSIITNDHHLLTQKEKIHVPVLRPSTFTEKYPEIFS